LGERLLCKQEVIGSIPFTSTRAGVRDQASGIRPNLIPDFRSLIPERGMGPQTRRPKKRRLVL
jgi:hypothetical protein